MNNARGLMGNRNAFGRLTADRRRGDEPHGREMALSRSLGAIGSRIQAMSRCLGIAVIALCQSYTLAVAMSVADRVTDRPILHSHIGSFIWLNPVEPAPAARLRALDGTAVDLSQFRGKLVLVNFWATRCILCVFGLPDLDRFVARQTGDRLAVIAVSMDQDGERSIAAFLTRNHLNHLPVYLDPNQAFAFSFPLRGIPVSYVIDEAGNIVGYVEGAVDWNSLEAQNFFDYLLKRARR